MKEKVKIWINLHGGINSVMHPSEIDGVTYYEQNMGQAMM